MTQSRRPARTALRDIPRATRRQYSEMARPKDSDHGPDSLRRFSSLTFLAVAHISIRLKFLVATGFCPAPPGFGASARPTQLMEGRSNVLKISFKWDFW